MSVTAPSSAGSSSDIYAQLGLGQQPTSTTTGGNDLGLDSFLRLMTEQMKSQDPTKPMDSSTFLGQLAQFSSVKGIQQVGSQLQGMTQMMGQQQALEVSNMIGHDAYIKTNTATLGATGTVNGMFTATAAGPVVVQIKDASGAVVREMTVQATSAGSTDFTWDGMNADGQAAAPGAYTVTAMAGTTQLDTDIAARVDSISFTAQGIVLNLEGHDAVTFDQIVRLS